MIGESGCGKTSIINYYRYGVSNIMVEPTLGASYIRHGEISIWDISGSPAYETLNQLYYRDADIVIIVCANHSASRVKKVIKKYINQTNKIGRMILVRNQIDKDSNNKDSTDLSELSATYNMEYFQTSAKLGTNIVELFDHIRLLASTHEVLKDKKTSRCCLF